MSEVSISLFWLLNNHPEVLDEWNAYMKPKREEAARKMKMKIDAIQKWLDESDIKEIQRKVIQLCLNKYNATDGDEGKKNVWNVLMSQLRQQPDFPYYRGNSWSEEE